VASVIIVKPSLANGGYQAKEGYKKYRPRKAQTTSLAGDASKLYLHVRRKTTSLPRVTGQSARLAFRRQCHSYLSLVATGFVAVALVLAWNVISTFKDNEITAKWTVWVAFWGSLGWLGGVARGLAGRSELIIDELKKVRAAPQAGP
jgi:hypothetical protein